MKFTRIAAALLIAGLASGTTFAQPSMRLAHGLADNHPSHLAMVRFAGPAKHKSHGVIKIFAHGALGGERESLDQVQNGVLEMTKAGASPLETFAPEYKVFNLPFVFRGKEHFFKVLDGKVGESILAASAKRGFIGPTFDVLLPAGERRGLRLDGATLRSDAAVQAGRQIVATITDGR